MEEAVWKRRTKAGLGCRLHEGRLLGVTLECATGRGAPADRLLVEKFVERLADTERAILASLVRVQFIPIIPWVEMEFRAVPERLRGVEPKQARYMLAGITWPEFGVLASVHAPLQVSLCCPGLNGLVGLDKTVIGRAFPQPQGDRATTPLDAGTRGATHALVSLSREIEVLREDGTPDRLIVITLLMRAVSVARDSGDPSLDPEEVDALFHDVLAQYITVTK